MTNLELDILKMIVFFLIGYAIGFLVMEMIKVRFYK